jgi:hypothetical protein
VKGLRQCQSRHLAKRTDGKKIPEIAETDEFVVTKERLCVIKTTF